MKTKVTIDGKRLDKYIIILANVTLALIVITSIVKGW